MFKIRYIIGIAKDLPRKHFVQQFTLYVNNKRTEKNPKSLSHLKT